MLSGQLLYSYFNGRCHSWLAAIPGQLLQIFCLATIHVIICFYVSVLSTVHMQTFKSHTIML